MSASKSKSSCSASAAPKWLVWSAVAFVAILSLVLAWTFVRRWMKPGMANEAFSDPKHSDKVIFLFMNGCGWCTKFEPTWEEFSKDAAPKLGVETFKFERSEEGAKEYMKHVEGFPTILFVNGATGKVSVFDGERTVEGLTAFVKAESSAAAPEPEPKSKESFDEPTEFGNMFNGVKAAKASADGSVAHMDKKIRDNAGGDLEKTSAT